MKRYKLLKDLPLAKAGTVLIQYSNGSSIWSSENDDIRKIIVHADVLRKMTDEEFDEWLEEINGGKPWKPEKGEKYHHLDDEGFPCMTVNSNCATDNNRISLGNCFKTKEEAKKAVRKLEALKRLRNKGLTFERWGYVDDVDNEENVEIRIWAKLRYEAIHDIDVRNDLTLLFSEEDKDD